MRDCILYADAGGLDERAGKALSVGFPRAWRRNAAGVARLSPRLMVSAEGWDTRDCPEAVAVSPVGATLAQAATYCGGDGWVVFANGRYFVEYDEVLLNETLAAARADAVIVSFDRELVSFRERVVVNREGQVLGFKRAYWDESAPAGLRRGSWHLLAVRRDAAGLDRTVISGDAAGMAGALRAAGIDVEAARIAGEAYALATDRGMLGYLVSHGRRRFDRGSTSGARIIGEVEIEAGARIGNDVTLIGPLLVCAGASIGDGATLSEAIVGPGAVVSSKRTVRNAVVLAGDPEPVAAGSGAGALRTRGSVFREWPALSYARAGKRALDIAGSIVALAILLTIFPIAAIAIRLNSRGPIFYAHRRQGLKGREFRCLKFRTMVAETGATQEDLRAINEVDGPQFKIEHDPRTTLVGEFLRETNIDEIPQFLNVLAGQMSIVGPRPSPDEENQMCPPWREARLSVKPGITGLWQVSRSADRKNDFQEWIHYDTEYVRTLSFRNDMAIMAKTVKVILGAFAQLFVSRRQTGQ